MATNDEESLEQFLPAPKIVKQIKDMQNHKQSSKKPQRIPNHVKAAWETLEANFTTRHKNLKQTPLKLCYAIVNDWMEGR